MLTTKEHQFVVAYCGEAQGNGAKAAELAGYAKGSARVTASRLLKKQHIRDAIANNQRGRANTKIADADERRARLSGILRRSGKNPVAAIKAADILNKMDGLYVQKHKHDVGPIQVVASHADERL